MCRLISWYFPRSSGVTMPPYVPAEKSWKYGNLDALLGWLLISINYLLIYLLIYLFISIRHQLSWCNDQFLHRKILRFPSSACVSLDKSQVNHSWKLGVCSPHQYLYLQPTCNSYTKLLSSQHVSVIFCQTFFWTNKNWLRSFNFPLNGDKSASAD